MLATSSNTSTLALHEIGRQAEIKLQQDLSSVDTQQFLGLLRKLAAKIQQAVFLHVVFPSLVVAVRTDANFVVAEKHQNTHPTIAPISVNVDDENFDLKLLQNRLLRLILLHPRSQLRLGIC